MLSDRGVVVDHTTLFRWVQADAAKLEQRVRRHLCLCTGSWRVDETYIKVTGVWTYLYRAVDSLGQTIDFLLSAKRDAAAARSCPSTWWKLGCRLRWPRVRLPRWKFVVERCRSVAV